MHTVTGSISNLVARSCRSAIGQNLLRKRQGLGHQTLANFRLGGEGDILFSSTQCRAVDLLKNPKLVADILFRINEIELEG